MPGAWPRWDGLLLAGSLACCDRPTEPEPEPEPGGRAHAVAPERGALGAQVLRVLS